MIRVDDLEIDLARRLVTRGGEPVHLTRTELTLLELLARHPGKLLTQEYLLREVWGPGYGTESNYLRVYVGQLRKKLGDDAARPRLILTEPGIGYRWIAGEEHAYLRSARCPTEHADHASRSSRTRTGTASGTRRSRRSACGS